jgi:hypothetical protein
MSYFLVSFFMFLLPGVINATLTTAHTNSYLKRTKMQPMSSGFWKAINELEQLQITSQRRPQKNN